MSSRIEQLIDEIEEYIDTCKHSTFNKSMILVNKDEIEELIHELRAKTPEEIRRYQKIIQNKEEILNDARSKAEQLITAATAQTTELINEHEIMQQAYAQANEVVTMASRQAQEILDTATMDANNMKISATQYTDDLLAHVEAIIDNSVKTAMADYESLTGNMKQYQDIIISNRKELRPADAEAFDDEDEDLASFEVPAKKTSNKQPADLDLI